MSKIFVLGYNKTGTKSLAKALEILGYNVLHMGAREKLIRIMYDNLVENKPILNRIGQFDCYLDYPIFEPNVFSHIVNEHRDAKYISLTRNYDDYVESVLKDKIKNLDDGIVDSWNWLGVGGKEVFENYPKYQKEWVKEKTKFKHQSNIRFLDKYMIDFLEMNICDSGDGWEELCSYLDQPIPNEEFPRE